MKYIKHTKLYCFVIIKNFFYLVMYLDMIIFFIFIGYKCYVKIILGTRKERNFSYKGKHENGWKSNAWGRD